MKGSRPLSDEEVRLVAKSFHGAYATRNKALFILGVRAGFRISELLSLRVGDIYRHGKVGDRISVHRRNMKGKTQGRTVLLHPEARAALSVWLEALQRRRGALDPELPVFHSRTKGADGTPRPIAGVRRGASSRRHTPPTASPARSAPTRCGKPSPIVCMKSSTTTS